ncbi:MAG: hypothetical protein M1608_10910, partial [Candidatus Omnitrophica bacterium]|nr:hypothetical protein [Candidatus Omnitrophota bacterium]
NDRIPGRCSSDVALVETYLRNTYINAAPVSVRLDFARSGDQLVLSWTEAGFVLQVNTDIGNSAGWTDVSGGNTSPVTINLKSSGQEFYRLRQQ